MSDEIGLSNFNAIGTIKNSIKLPDYIAEEINFEFKDAVMVPDRR